MSDHDEDFDLEPHTPATLGDQQGTGHFPHVPTVGGAALLPDPMQKVPPSTTTTGAAARSASQSQQQQQPASSSPPRYVHKPYSVSPRQSPAIPLDEQAQQQQPGVSPLRTPVGSLDQRATAMPPGSRGRLEGVPPLGSSNTPSMAPYQPQPTSGYTQQPTGPMNYAPQQQFNTPPHGGKSFKTEMCRQISAPGGCFRGSNCQYAHSVAELQTPGMGIGIGVSGRTSSSPNLIGQQALRPRLSGASVDDGGRMGAAMNQEVPRPSWMQPSSVPSASIPVSPIAEAMMRPQGGSVPRGSLGGAGSAASPMGPNQQPVSSSLNRNQMGQGSAPKFSSSLPKR
jgi:hypothetical protein